MNHDVASRAVGNHFSFSEHDASIGNSGNNFNIVSRDNDGMAIGRKLRKNFNQSLLCSVIKAASGLVKQKQRRFRGQHDREGKAKTLSL
jgi:hypothetical protein